MSAQLVHGPPGKSQLPHKELEQRSQLVDETHPYGQAVHVEHCHPDGKLPNRQSEKQFIWAEFEQTGRITSYSDG